MVERPLVFFATPSNADKEKRHGGFPNFKRPSLDRQNIRLAPQFAILQHTLEQGNVRISTLANAIEPEYTLVFEAAGDPSAFFTAINYLKKQYPNIEWIMELSSNCPNDDDFYVVDDNGNRDDEKRLSTKIFCILTNLTALNQIISLWNNFSSNEHFQFEKGLAGLKQLFSQLKSVHLWGIQERIEDTGLVEDWISELKNEQCSFVRTQIELFYRSSTEKQRVAEKRITDLITSVGGNVICRSLIPEIQYHALLVEIPRNYALEIINKKDVELVLADEIMFMKGGGQTISSSAIASGEDCIMSSTPKTIVKDPIVALFDGMPQENHPLLSDLLILDDPDSISQYYPVEERIHGTSMASLILHGEQMGSLKESVHRIYIRPIMKSKKDFHNRVQEYIPDDCLLVDKIHECVRRLFETSAGRVAPSVRIINLSIGISYREYYNLISPLARLLDWLSYKYRVLFIVSAGNHSDEIILDMDYASFSSLTNLQKDQFVFKYISNNLRKLRLLSPAESMNALTIGAVFTDDNDSSPDYNMITLCSKGIPALYGSFGRGINNSIKPDFLYDGGRCFVRQAMVGSSKASWADFPTRKPGIQSAYPGTLQQGVGNVGYTCGTSNSAALISNKAAECFDVLNDVFLTETGDSIPYDFSAVLIKAMLAHSASWSNLKTLCHNYLSLSGQKEKSIIHQFLGYGVVDVDKTKECTKNQITLIGYGNIKQDQAFVYSIPLPFNFHDQKFRRKLTVTLAYLSSIHPSSLKYRGKQVWFTLNNGKKISGEREYDFNAVQRGTLQHEIFETDSTEVWDENDLLEIKVNCRGDASEKDPGTLIPYALFATFEMAPEYGIDVYQMIVEKIHVHELVQPIIQ